MYKHTHDTHLALGGCEDDGARLLSLSVDGDEVGHRPRAARVRIGSQDGDVLKGGQEQTSS